MEIIPAIDLRGGRCVRLLQGDPARMIVYGDDPVAVARRWIGEGAQRLHVVDLDGAFAGHPVQLALVEAIARLGVPVQVGGGFRTLEDLEVGLASGADRVILGTAALTLAAAAASRFGPCLVASIDTKDGQTAVGGWTVATGVDPISLAMSLKARGIRRFIYTDIARDGMLTGPAVAALRTFVSTIAVPVMAAGGVATTADVDALDGTGVEGVIIGRALYEGHITLHAMLARGASHSC